MAFEIVKLSNRGQWVQNLEENLKRMITLADFWACLLDNIDKDDTPLTQHLLWSLLNANMGGKAGWQYAKHYLLKGLTKEQKQGYKNARQISRGLYELGDEFDAHERIIMTYLIGSLYIPSCPD